MSAPFLLQTGVRKEFLRWRKSRDGTGAQPLQDLKFTGRGNPPVVALLC
ncbi:hypothetical protein [Pseudanabaena galeata]|nr:hypothetical protein [Pseudanabaena galeata]